MSSIRSSGRNGGRSPRASTSTRVTAVSIASSGSALETAQSEPIANGAPARSSERERVLPGGPFRPEERDRQVVHLRVMARPQRLGVGVTPSAREPADVVGMDDLDVGDVRPGVASGR